MLVSMNITEALPHLPAGVVRHMLSTFIDSLPPPFAHTPESLTARDEAAIAALFKINWPAPR